MKIRRARTPWLTARRTVAMSEELAERLKLTAAQAGKAQGADRRISRPWVSRRLANRRPDRPAALGLRSPEGPPAIRPLGSLPPALRCPRTMATEPRARRETR
jgi:hypothetical protein